jgi:hypothetical protein
MVFFSLRQNDGRRVDEALIGVEENKLEERK